MKTLVIYNINNKNEIWSVNLFRFYDKAVCMSPGFFANNVRTAILSIFKMKLPFQIHYLDMFKKQNTAQKQLKLSQ